MGYDDYIRVKLGYLEARFLCGFLVEKYDELIALEQTERNKELLGFVKTTHNKIMKELEND